MGAFRLPPVDNLLRACPVLDVTDNRRLTLWVAFGLTLLGGIGLDQLGQTRRLARGWLAAGSSARLVLGSLACAIRDVRAGDPRAGRRPLSPGRRARAGADAADYQRAGRAPGPAGARVSAAVLRPGRRRSSACWPRWRWRRRRSGAGPAGSRPCSARADAGRPGPVRLRSQSGDRPSSDHERRAAGDRPAAARAAAGDAGRSALGEELPPNVLMRFGLADVRNYDSVELARSLAWFDADLSRRDRGVVRADATSPGTAAIRAARPAARVGRRRDRRRDAAAGRGLRPRRAGRPASGSPGSIAEPWAEVELAGGRARAGADDHGEARILSPIRRGPIAWSCARPGTRAGRPSLDGRPAAVEPGSGPFLEIEIPSGEHELIL